MPRCVVDNFNTYRNFEAKERFVGRKRNLHDLPAFEDEDAMFVRNVAVFNYSLHRATSQNTSQHPQH
jgi:hypothetical protein